MIAGPGLALAAGKRIFLVRRGMEKDREILADRAKAHFPHGLRSGADDDEITVRNRPPEQLIADRAADDVDLHRQPGN